LTHLPVNGVTVAESEELTRGKGDSIQYEYGAFLFPNRLSGIIEKNVIATLTDRREIDLGPSLYKVPLRFLIARSAASRDFWSEASRYLLDVSDTIQAPLF
jgi:hypothetical protein